MNQRSTPTPVVQEGAPAITRTVRLLMFPGGRRWVPRAARLEVHPGALLTRQDTAFPTRPAPAHPWLIDADVDC